MAAPFLLVENTEQLKAVVEARTRIANVIEESLRRDSPVQGLFCTTTREVELGGVPLPRGAHLELLYSSGNRDESRFNQAHRFDVDRKDSSNHMALGFGIHPLLHRRSARALRRPGCSRNFARRLPNQRLVPGQLVEHHPHFFLAASSDSNSNGSDSGTLIGRV